MFYSMQGKQGTLKNIVDLKDVDVCQFLDDPSVSAISRIVKMFKDMVITKGDLPRCPLKKNDVIVYNMLNMDYKAFPYLPEMDFKLAILWHLNNVRNAYHINVTGTVVNRKKGLLL